MNEFIVITFFVYNIAGKLIYHTYTNEWKDMTQKKIAFPRQKIGATFIPMTVIMSALDDMNMKDVR